MSFFSCVVLGRDFAHVGDGNEVAASVALGLSRYGDDAAPQTPSQLFVVFGADATFTGALVDEREEIAESVVLRKDAADSS